MSTHLNDRLSAIPVPPLQLESIVRRGERLRRGRRTLTLFASSVTTVIVFAGLLTLPDLLGRGPDSPRNQQPVMPTSDTLDLDVFLKDNISSKQRRDVRRVANDVEGVLTVRFISKRAAYNEFKQQYRDRPKFWENLPKNALPARFVVTLQDEAYVAEARERLRPLAGVDEVCMWKSPPDGRFRRCH